MVRQAHNYLVGALSGVTLIGIAIAVFVVLVSAQVFHDWPIAALSSHNDQAAVAPAKALPGADQSAEAVPTATTAGASHAHVAKAGTATGAPLAKRAHRHHAASSDATGPATVVEAAPDPTAAGEESSGGNSGSHSSHPSSSSATSTSPAPSSNSGAGSGGTSGSSSSGGGGTATGSSGNGGSTTTTPPATAATKPLSEAVVETADGTVGAVNEVTGGTLEKAGVTQVTEEVVKGLAGPESVVGNTVDGVGESLKGLLGGGEG
jgi:hypothetical protein